jgi:nicotinate-nucleotide adenylyltransferase
LSGRINSPRNRIGIFGGTFDPPHIAHLVLAMEACDQLGLKKLLWVLTASPPHKQDHFITPVEQREELVQAALYDDPLFELSRVEIDRPGPHYAADTMQFLAEENPNADLCYLIGGDSLRDLPGWYRPKMLLEYCECLGVMRRPGDAIDLDKLESQLPGINQKLRFIETPIMDVSSSAIRSRIRSGRSFRYYLPESVYNLIVDKGYYPIEHV